MIQEELTIRLPPALDNGDGTFRCRTFPLTVYARPGWRQVQLAGVDIVPNVGIVEVWATDFGGQSRRHASQGGTTAIPQTAADELRPLTVTLVNLNHESAVDVVVRFASFPLFQGFGGSNGAARFTGPFPFGTNGDAETLATIVDTNGNTIRQADGVSLSAFLTVDGPFELRNIRQVTGQVRILSPTGTGSIPTSGGPTRTVIIKKDGVVLEASADTINMLSTMFDLTVAPTGQVNIVDFAAGAIEADHLSLGAVDSLAIDNGAVQAQHISAGAVNDPAMLATGVVTFAKLAAAAIGTGSNQVAAGNHLHNVPLPTKWMDFITLGNAFHAVNTGGRVNLGNFNCGPLASGVDYIMLGVAVGMANAGAGGTIELALRLEAGETPIPTGMITGTVGGDRTLVVVRAKRVTGAGSSVNFAIQGIASGANASVSDGMLFGLVLPLTL